MKSGTQNQIEGDLKKMGGSIQKEWGKITGNLVTQIEGDRTKLVGAVQKNYGVAQAEAERQVNDWQRRWDAERLNP